MIYSWGYIKEGDNMIEIKNINSPFIYCCQKVIPLAFDESMSYYETLCNLIYKIKEVIDEQNNEGLAIQELQEKYILLKDYVDHYFDSLDIQEEVNNKLDEMALDGTLENLIGQYIELATTYVYNNVEEMKGATNLVNGSFARTSGFYEYNDGGGAYYKIRTLLNTDVVDNIHLFTLEETDNLVAELIVNDFNLLKFGAKNGEDITDIIKYVLSIMSNGDTMIIPTGEFEISESLYIDKIISIEGTSLSINNGTKLIFETNGIILRQSNIVIKNITIIGNKDNYNTLDIENNVFGKVGIICEYSDQYESGGIKLESVNINSFNVGIVIYSTRTSNKWSGAYRQFKNCTISYNDIGYIIKDGATYNSIIGGNISSNEKYGLYIDTNVFYQNIEIIDTALEINGRVWNEGTGTYNLPPYLDTVDTFGCYISNSSKVKFTNCYLEVMDIFVNNGGTAIFESCHIHSNVQCYGKGQILSIGSHGVFNNEYDFGSDLANNSTNTGLTLANTYSATTKYIRITSNNTGDNLLALPNILNIPIPLKNIENIKIEFDAKVDNGYQNTNFGLKPRLQIVGYGSNNGDYQNVEETYPVKNIIPTHDEWCHLTYFYKPKISLMEDTENIIYRASLFLYFNNDINNNASDFSVNNLDMGLANPKITIYANSNV